MSSDEAMSGSKANVLSPNDGDHNAGRASDTSRGQTHPLRSWLRRHRSGPVMSLNLTPMIDIVFLLLFFFLAVSRFRTMEGMLPARLPAPAAAVSTDIPRTPIRIRFVADFTAPGRFRVTIDRFGESPLAIGSLAGALADIRDHQPGFDTNTPVHLLAGDEVSWDDVVNAYNAALAARYERIFFAGSS